MQCKMGDELHYLFAALAFTGMLCASIGFKLRQCGTVSKTFSLEIHMDNN